MRPTTALRQEVKALRQAIEDIKRDLPIQSSHSSDFDEGLMSFRPAPPDPIPLPLSNETHIIHDLQLIKDKIDSLKTTWDTKEDPAPETTLAKPKQTVLISELTRLQEENKALKELLVSKTTQKTTKTKTKKQPKAAYCENCAFLRAKGFESDLCYRHREKTVPSKTKRH